MKADFRVIIPANLLLTGEYIITLDNSLGIGFSVDRYTYIFVSKNNCKQFQIFSKINQDFFHYTEKRYDIFLESVKCILGYLYSKFEIVDYLNYFIDTSQLYEKENKLGLGSSATCLIGVVQSFLLYYNIKYDIVDLILDYYKNSKINVGSFYEFYTSVYGGVILFEGGRPVKSFKKIESQLDFASLSLINKKPVKSTSSLKKFLKYKKDNEEYVKNISDMSNKLTEKLIETKDYKMFIEILDSIKNIYIELGYTIGINSNPALDEVFAKCLGAGDEVILLINNKKYESKPINIDYKGIRWN